MQCPPLPAEDLDAIVDQTRDLWEQARNANLFITGGTGFFGIWLLESFNRANDRLGLRARATVLTRDPTGFKRKLPHLGCRQDLHFLEGDFETFPFPEGDFPLVIHAANPATGVRTTGAGAQRATTPLEIGIDRLLEFVFQAKTSRLLLTSSGAVYGPPPATMNAVPEDYCGSLDPSSPRFDYATGKRRLEAAFTSPDLLSRCDVKIARCFAFIGPHLPLTSEFAAGNFLYDVLRHESPKITGDGSSVRSYLYAGDLVAWLWTILFGGRSARPYNVGSAEPVSIQQLAAVIAELAGVPPRDVKKTMAGAEKTGRYLPDVTRAKNELGLCQTTSLAEAVQRTLRWYRPLFP